MYRAELDDHPLEVRRGLALNALPFWPKHPGFGNVAIEPGSTPTYSIFKPDGSLIAENLAATVLEIEAGDAGVSQFLLIVDASDTNIYQLGDNYRIDVKWLVLLQVGMIRTQHPEALESIRFACVREPYIPRLSANDIIDELADAAQFLRGQAQAIAVGRTVEQHASVLSMKAWCDVHDRLQTRFRAEGKIYPRAVIDRRKLDRLVISQTLYRLFDGEGGTERSAELATKWKEKTDERFNMLGELDYDTNDDGVKDTTLRPPVERRLRRSWT